MGWIKDAKEKAKKTKNYYPDWVSDQLKRDIDRFRTETKDALNVILAILETAREERLLVGETEEGFFEEIVGKLIVKTSLELETGVIKVRTYGFRWIVTEPETNEICFVCLGAYLSFETNRIVPVVSFKQGGLAAKILKGPAMVETAIREWLVDLFSEE